VRYEPESRPRILRMQPVVKSGRSRFYFRRKTGYMSGYYWRTVLNILRTHPDRGIPIADLYIRIGWTAFRIRRGEYRAWQPRGS
jgi:hypothetical protein